MLVLLHVGVDALALCRCPLTKSMAAMAKSIHRFDNQY